jgi:predicted house-cleaning noncanonical NTP pyrophosphatase (MazG superfamily)
MNYTRIDFSENNNKNINICKKINDDNIEWSFASLDRIDSTKEYDYDNVEIISHYYNSQVKNCASHSQIGKLYYYQLKKLLNKKINKELVKSMSDDELYKVSDMFSVYFKLFEIVNDNNTILHKEMVRRDKKSKLVVKI